MGIKLELDTPLFADKTLGLVENKEIANKYLSYIESDGASYINTNFTAFRNSWGDSAGNIPDDVPSIEITFQLINEVVPTVLLGCSGSTNVVISSIANNTLNVVGRGASGTFDINSGQVNTLKYGSVYSYVNGTLVKDNSQMANQYRINPLEYPLLLFASDYTTSAGTNFINSILRIYEFKGYIGDSLVVHLKPFADENGIVCMKDVVTNTCIYNSGAGVFKAGSVIGV